MKKWIFRLILAVNKILEYQYQSIVNPDSRKLAWIHNPGVFCTLYCSLSSQDKIEIAS